MPALRPALSTTEKLIAVYSDPAQYARAAVFANQRPAQARRRETTYFMLDAEALIHGSQTATARTLQDPDLWDLRRDLCLETTGEDLLLAVPPTLDVLGKWRDRRLPAPVPRIDPDTNEPLPVDVWLKESTQAYKEGIPNLLTELRAVHEHQAMALADQVRVQPPSEWDNAAHLTSDELLVADGTVIEPQTGVETYQDRTNGETRVAGSRATDPANARLSVRQSSTKPHGPVAGINHVALMARTEYGRIVFTIDRAMGGETHAALDGLERLHDLAPQRMRAICYDSALSGWQADYVFARYGLLSISPLIAAHGDAKERQSAQTAVAQLHTRQGARTPTTRVQAELQRTWALSPQAPPVTRDAVNEYVAAAAEGRAAGSGLPLGQSVTIDRATRTPIPKKGVYGLIDTAIHYVDGAACEHDLYLDNGGVWTVRNRQSRLVKDERLHGQARRTWNERTGNYVLEHTFSVTCMITGEIFDAPITQRFDGVRRDLANAARKPRRPVQDIRLVAESDPLWRSIYGCRNDTESWFSWLKNTFATTQSRFSLNLDHAFLEMLHAAALTNSVTRYYAVEEGVID